MHIKDLETGRVFEYGTDRHDSIKISRDGCHLEYRNLQNGEGSGEYGCYRFVVDEDGCIPDEDEDLVKHGADAYFDIALAGLVKEKDVVTKRQIRHALEWILHMNDGKDVSEERLKGVNDAYSALTNLLLLNKWQI